MGNKCFKPEGKKSWRFTRFGKAFRDKDKCEVIAGGKLYSSKKKKRVVGVNSVTKEVVKSKVLKTSASLVSPFEWFKVVFIILGVVAILFILKIFISAIAGIFWYLAFFVGAVGIVWGIIYFALKKERPVIKKIIEEHEDGEFFG